MTDIYTPPVISNGILSLTIDYEGQQRQVRHPNHPNTPLPRIWCQGRRQRQRIAGLIPYGHFEQHIAVNGEAFAEPTHWSQDLNVKQGLLESTATYGEQLQLKATSFVVQGKNIIALKRTLTNISAKTAHVDFDFTFFFDAPGQPADLPPEDVKINLVHTGVSCGYFEYETTSLFPADGYLSVKTTVPNIKTIASGNSLAFPIKAALRPGASKVCTFFIFLNDKMDSPDYTQGMVTLKHKLLKNSFNDLIKEHKAYWTQFWKRLDLILPNVQLTRCYMTALYHLKCLETPWGIPVGIFDTHWSGRFFGFDEYFAIDALVSAGFADNARNASLFRAKYLQKAISETCSSREVKAGKCMANFPWQTIENGSEGGSQGFWSYHVFHNAHIALAAWQNFRFTDDKDFLQNVAYPLLKSAAEFYVLTMTYDTPDGNLIIGSCTDFERLGSAHKNPFATTCAVIATLDAANEASQLLDIDDELRLNWASQARRLLNALPHDDRKYLPYPECTENNIGLLSGIYPYGVTDTNDPRQKNAFDDFSRTIDKTGNMYSVGSGVCSWYYAWQAAVAARYKDSELTEQALLNVAKQTGSAGELYEICEPENNVVMRPWFMTAEATYIRALNMALLQSNKREIHILPATPESWQDLDFTLPAVGAITVKVKIRKNHATHITLHNNTSHAQRRIIQLPDYITLETPLTTTRSYSIPAHSTIRLA